MDLSSEHLEAAAQALSSLPEHQGAEFYDWFNRFQSSDTGLRYLYGAHVFRVIGFDRDRSPAYQPDMPLTPTVTRAVDSLLVYRGEPLGTVNKDVIVLRIDRSAESDTGTLLVVDMAGIDVLLQKLFGNSGITHSEKRTLLQVVCGLSLRDAAVEDSVNYETKRSQLKAVAAKTGVKRQADLRAFVLARLLFDMSRWSPEMEAYSAHACFREYVRRFMPGTVRSHVVLDDCGRHCRLLDMGEQSGTPVVIMHSQALPHISQQDIELFHTLNLRLIWPLRHGALAPEDEFLSFDDHLQATTDCVRIVQDLFCGERMVLMCLMSGGFYGVHYATHFPQQIDKLILVGSCYKPDVSDSAPGRFRNGLFKLTSSNRTLTNLLLHFLGQKLRSTDSLKEFLSTLYATSHADSKVLAMEFSSTELTEALQYRFINSELSIAHDFYHHAFPNWTSLLNTIFPVHFIHGADDPVHSVDSVAELASLCSARMHVLPDAGQLMYHHHMAHCMQLVDSIVNDRGNVHVATLKDSQRTTSR